MLSQKFQKLEIGNIFLSKNILNIFRFFTYNNYEKHLKDCEITSIPEAEIRKVIDKFYDGEDRRKHIRIFVLNGIQKLSENGGHCDLNKINILLEEIMNDECIVKNRVYTEILLYQKSKK